MSVTIELKLFATLKAFEPANGAQFAIQPGMTVGDLIDQLHIPLKQVKLIFVDNIIRDPSAILRGGERVGIFPPVGGG